MRYNFRNEKTGEVIEKSFPMTEVPSSFVENGITYVRDYASEFSGGGPAIQIPEHMRAGAPRRIMSGNRKSPSGRKHFY